MSKKTRFTDSELQEFKSLIEEKIEKAKADLDLLKSSYMNDGNNVLRILPRLLTLSKKGPKPCQKKQTLNLLFGKKSLSVILKMP